MKTLIMATCAFMIPVAALVIMRRDDLQAMLDEESSTPRAGHVYFFTAPG